MRWICGMVELMMRRAHEHAPQKAGEWYPDLTVLELRGKVNVQQHQHVLVEQGERHRLSPQRVLGEPADYADEQREIVGEDKRIARGNGKVEGRPQHFGRVVRLVQL